MVLRFNTWIDGRNVNRANVPVREWGAVGRGEGGGVSHGTVRRSHFINYQGHYHD